MISGKALTVPCFFIFSRVHHIIADPVATFSGFCCLSGPGIYFT